jgi:hypothetical protein
LSLKIYDSYQISTLIEFTNTVVRTQFIQTLRICDNNNEDYKKPNQEPSGGEPFWLSHGGKKNLA